MRGDGAMSCAYVATPGLEREIFTVPNQVTNCGLIACRKKMLSRRELAGAQRRRTGRLRSVHSAGSRSSGNFFDT